MILGLGNTIPSDSVRQGLGGGGGGGFDNTYSLAFDGVDDFVKANLVDGGSIIGGSKTISWWMKLDQYNTTEMIMSIRGTSGADYFSAWKTNTGQVRFGCRGAVTHGRSADTTKYDVTTLTDWTHFLVTKKLGLFSRGEIVKIFINGVDVTGGNTTVNGGVANEIKIGQIGNIGYMGSLLHGSVDELAVFDGELDSPAEVASIYNGGTPNDLTSLNPLVWYRMGDNGSYKSPQWLIPNNSNKDKVSNYSFDFDGVDDRVEFGALTNIVSSAPYSVSLWFKQSGSGNEFLISGGPTGASEFNASIYLRPADNQIWLDGSTAAQKWSWSNVNNDWQHLLFVDAGGGTYKLYSNGVSETLSSVTTYLGAQADLWIGARTSGNHFDGEIDEVAFFNSDVSGDIATLYNSGTPTTLPSGAVAHYKMGEEAIFTSNWLVNNSALSNYSTRSFNFDGVDDRVDVGAVSFLPSATNLTVSTWLKTSDVTDNQVVFGDNSATPIFSFEYWGSANRMYFEYGSGLYCYLTLNLVVSNDVWHNLALVYDGSGATNTDKIKIYINGVDKSSSLTFVGTVPTALSASIGNLWLGNGQNYNSPFLGNIDEFAIWNSSLTQENITSIYGGGTPSSISSLSPISHWRMGEDATFSTNWSLPDNGSASNTGTSANMTIADLEGDAPNYTGGGLSNNMTIEDRVGDAPNSTSNALSYNMTESDRETDTP